VSGRGGSPTRRLLIVADESCGLRELRRGARERADDHTAIRLVVPVKMLRVWFRDEGEARSSARDRLDEVLDGLRRDGVTATGHLGGVDPVTAIAEALADFPADEILIFTGPDEESWWLHKETLERAHARFQLPIAQVVLNPPRDLAAVA
jgi:hypothetical protein